MSRDIEVINEEIEKSDHRVQAAKVFREAGFTINYVKDGSGTSKVAVFYLEPSRGLAQILGSDLEIVTILSEFPDFDARNVEQARKEIKMEEGEVRLSSEVAFIITGDKDTSDKVNDINKRRREIHTQLVGFSLDELEACKPIGDEDFVRQIQLRFYSRDLYQPRGPVRSPINFFGREAIISEIKNELRNGTGHIGVFGLRKMGKTSLLYRIVDSLRSNSKIAHSHVDLQSVVSTRPSPEYLLWYMSEKLLDENEFIRNKADFRLFGKYALFSEIENKDTVFERFRYDINNLIDEQERIKFVFMLDEIELIAHNVKSSSWEGEEFLRFWRFLRGIDQENPYRLNFFVTGTNPSCIEQNKIEIREEKYGYVERHDNPTYDYFDIKFLQPLDKENRENDNCKRLLNDIGERMGLKWKKEAVDQVAEFVGGHPSLLRHYASMVHKQLSPREQQKIVDDELVRSLAPDFIRAHSSDFSQMIDVLREEYPDEYFLLEMAAQGQVGEFREWAEASPKDVAHLRGYGLVDDHLRGVGFKIDLLQQWLQQRQQPSESPETERLKSPGDRVEEYKIIESTGHTGGFSEVYKAKPIGAQDGELVALKILKGGSFSRLQREVDALSAVDHPHVVELLDHSRSADGDLYLVMEFLQGNTLRHHCRKATRLPEDEVAEIACQLLDALITLHPNKHKLESLRNKAELSEEELEEINEARQGYLHRDIKPENVIYNPRRGPVLIDFGITSRVKDDIRTRTSTPGYLPPDLMQDPEWTVDVDLYQLGLTLLQVSVGVRFRADEDLNEDNMDDLRTLAEEQLTNPLRRTLLKMVADKKAERWNAAREAHEELN